MDVEIWRSLRGIAQVSIIVAVTGLPNVALSQMSPMRAMADFRTVDTDRDGKLDRGELAAAADRDFVRLDVDGDGTLTRAELARTHRKTLLLPFPGRFSSRAAFAAADTDRDRKIDKNEYETAVVGAYMRCDRNRDGTIELSDLRHCSM